jgi:hypothetical protein
MAQTASTGGLMDKIEKKLIIAMALNVGALLLSTIALILKIVF